MISYETCISFINPFQSQSLHGKRTKISIVVGKPFIYDTSALLVKECSFIGTILPMHLIVLSPFFEDTSHIEQRDGNLYE